MTRIRLPRPRPLADALRDVAAEVEAALDDLLPPVEGAEARLVEAMRYATLGGGKRMRAFLVMEAAALFGVDRTLRRARGAAIEMVHAYSLVHDDLPAMDDDDLRRGKPRATARSTRRPPSWPATRCRPAPSRCWPSTTPIPTRRRAANWWRRWRWRPARAAWSAGR